MKDFDTTKDFWKEFPELKHLEPFNTADSTVMWAIALVYDCDSPLFNLRLKEREEIAYKNIILPKNIEELSLMYIKLQEDSEKRYLKVWNDKVDEIADVLKTWIVTQANISRITKALLEQEQLMEQKDKIIARMRRQEYKKIHGGKTLSLLEADKI